MTGKLIKYEFRSILKIMGIGWAALLSMALFAGLFDHIAFRQNDLDGSSDRDCIGHHVIPVRQPVRSDHRGDRADHSDTVL